MCQILIGIMISLLQDLGRSDGPARRRSRRRAAKRHIIKLFLPGQSLTRVRDARMDRDTLSGRMLERFKRGRCPDLFHLFCRCNEQWLSRYIAGRAEIVQWGLDPDVVVADIFHDVYRFSGGYTFFSGAAFRRWMCTIARNRLRKAMRECRSRPISLSGEGKEWDDWGEADPLRLLVWREEYTELLAGWRLLVRVCRAGLERLPSEEQGILEGHFLDGMTYRLIATRYRLSLPEVAVHIRRGRRSVARFMKDFFHRAGAGNAAPSSADGYFGLR